MVTSRGKAGGPLLEICVDDVAGLNAAVAGGAVALASASSTESTPGAVPLPGQAAPYKPDLQMLVTRETPERYRPRACEYIEMALVEVPIYLAATTEPLLQQAGEARKVA